MTSSETSQHKASFSAPRGFLTTFKSDLKETFFPDDPLTQFHDDKPLRRFKKAIQYFIPIFKWLPNYKLSMFRFDLLAGITIASLAIPQGISYAKLAGIPPIIGLYSSFAPPLVYAVFGDSKHLAVGTVAACSLFLAETIGKLVSRHDDPTLYLHLFFTATFVTGITQAALGFLRLGILVDFLSHSTITGFMGGTAILICLQQLKGFFGMKHFTNKTDVVSVIRSVIAYKHEFRWESFVTGIIFLIFLQFTRYLGQKKPKLFMISAVAPILVVAVGCVFAYLIHGQDHGIEIVGPLKKGINPPSIQYMNFDSKYISAVIKGGTITALIALAEGIAIGRSFAILNNDHVDGNKEMMAFGLMNLVGSFTSCYLTTGPFSKTAVNYNAGSKTPMSNVVMAICMGLTLQYLAPLFSHTPIVALSAIIFSAMLGLIKYKHAIHLFKVDKFDFFICMVAFFGVAFISMDIGLMLSVGLSVLRALLYVARPGTCKLGRIPNSSLYRDTKQYPAATVAPGILVLQLGSPIYFANSNYIRERVLRWIQEEQSKYSKPEEDDIMIEHVLLDLTGVSTIDVTGIETLIELRRTLEGKGIEVAIINPNLNVTEKLIASHFIDKIGEENIYLSIGDAVDACELSFQKLKVSDAVSEHSDHAV
ncbi:hypothetical protein FNV43_RR25205 [Rhamnella rubrinervis]|uniref:STAS domain-containing protein n=1 Tax=Rhamnella rubrinervis TaxID=2594499 RepID=A0A8K0DMX8_9ROSA|nr:hypothetical protein FNV43_RR25205 [Rhamnella rubrinervis]